LVSCRVLAEAEAPDQTLEAIVQNVSLTGLFIEMTTDVPLNARLALEFVLNGTTLTWWVKWSVKWRNLTAASTSG